jgi:hypothetical protein
MMMQLKRVAQICAVPLVLGACGDGDELPDDPAGDSGMMDAGPWDAGPLDGRVPDGGRD